MGDRSLTLNMRPFGGNINARRVLCLCMVGLWAGWSGPARAALPPDMWNGQSAFPVDGWAAEQPFATGDAVTEPAEVDRSNLGWLGSVNPVTAGRVQLEIGTVYSAGSADELRLYQHTWPDALLRVGMTERLELRLGWPGIIDESLRDGSTNESLRNSLRLDPQIGVLWDALPQDGIVPQTGLLVSVPIATEGNPFAEESLQPLVGLLYSWTLTDLWSVGGTSSVAMFRDGNDDYLQYEQTGAVELALGERWATFVEYALLIADQSSDDGQQHLISTGLAWALTDRIVVSWRAGIGLNDRAPDYLTGLRVSMRY